MNSSTVYLDTSSITYESPDTCHCALIPQRDTIFLSVILAQKSEPANISFGHFSFVRDSIGKSVEAPLLVIFNDPGNSTCVELNCMNGRWWVQSNCTTLHLITCKECVVVLVNYLFLVVFKLLYKGLYILILNNYIMHTNYIILKMKYSCMI